jgi:hypothetical protein
MSNKNWSIDYSDIRIGNPRVIVDPRITDASAINLSSVFISKLVPNSDSNVQNESFSQSLIDPGDWVSLEHGSLLIMDGRHSMEVRYTLVLTLHTLQVSVQFFLNHA